MPRIPPASGRMKKGETRNPKGSSAKARAIAKARRMSADDLADLTSLLLTGNKDRIAEVAQDPDSNFMQVLTAKLLVECYKKGDISIYKAILDRVIGKPKESKSVELTGKDGAALDLTMTRTDMTMEEKQARADALAQARKAVGED